MSTPENDPTPAAAGVGVPLDGEPEEFLVEFKCCVCLELIFKPVVLACGHISCFWCVLESMEIRLEMLQRPRCPVCRHPYYHFPGICWLLHSVLLKLYPNVCRRRESQVAEKEKAHGKFSPQFENYLAASHGSEQISSQFHSLVLAKDCSHKKSPEPVPSDDNCPMGIPESSSDEITKKVVVEGICSTGSDHVDRCCKQILITDLLCAICKELLYRPVVLNCGHVFCEACIIDSLHEPCQCPVCQSMHINGFPKDCLVLVGFLEQHKSKEYAARRLAIEKVGTCDLGGSLTGLTQVQQGAKSSSVPMHKYYCCYSGHKVHNGVGRDSCGIYPLTGDRYKCKDCSVNIGYDLCGYCYYNCSPHYPKGRFNQQHKPHHECELVKSGYIIVPCANDSSSADDDEGINTERVPENDAAGPDRANDSSSADDDEARLCNII